MLGAAGLVLGAAAAGAGVGGAGGSRGGGGGGAAAAVGSVLVQGEVGSRNDADVELGIWEGVCDMKRPAWNCVFQLKDKKIYCNRFFFPARTWKSWERPRKRGVPMISSAVCNE